ncbi:MAG: ribosome maturation factor RimM [Nitrosomonadales bacterium]|jgi:16S rRNA processing protein RimM|nr:ribosome maturation factor RimM [Nitrosomonadales bacterium]MBT4571569.1 ribosome maturation factor RimM [Nitrosomonadales bacterium]MBT6014992.1 ribosome maturation factor RimM [Nitrosomonadales bacterium]MBT6251233.1 ribosome maturation factor RimM [Nitrosomonadales bacterium]MBT6603235.1 ribosome maturation factor RimM [Nitrosomonadales bacterium]
MKEDYLVMGQLVGSFGIKGWLKVKVFTEKVETLEDYKEWFISSDEKNWSKIRVENVKINQNRMMVKFEEIDDRTSADGYRKYWVGILKESLPKLDGNEFYWNDLIGCEVQNINGFLFGTVSGFIETGANDVLVVEGEKQRLIPYTKMTVKKIELKRQQIIVDWDESF